MAWPTPQDYNEAVQNPRSAFTDPDLVSGQPELNALGLPRPITGGFACVYKIQNSGKTWAARCFLTEVTDQQERYEAISKHLHQAKIEHTVHFSYLPTGIRVQGRAVPLVKMEWVQGESLSAFVGRCIGYGDTLTSLARVWFRMLADLKSANISHGDLQHGNVLVVGDRLRLIDYDGMFVPALSNKSGRECGHRNYQHPSRTEFHYGPFLDNFPAWVVYVSLVALSIHPELWRKYNGGDECLLFRKEDFVQPHSSSLFQDLIKSPNGYLRSLSQLFSNILDLSLEDIPSLEDLQSSSTGTTPKAPVLPAGPNWWEDHVPQKVVSPKDDIKDPAEPDIVDVVPEVDWILDELNNQQPAEKVRFRGEMTSSMLVLVGSVLLSLIIGLLPEVSVVARIGASVGVFALGLLFCFVRYLNDPSYQEYQGFRAAMGALKAKLQEEQQKVEAISAEKAKALKNMSGLEENISKQKKYLARALEAELARYQDEFNVATMHFNQQKRVLDDSEAHELRDKGHDYQNKISAVDRSINSLSQAESEEKKKLLEAARKVYVEEWLRRFSIQSGHIDGIGPSFKARLVAHGIRTAADAEYQRIRRVDGIGPKRARAIDEWKRYIEAQAYANAPQSLSNLERARIEKKYEDEGRRLRDEKNRLENQINILSTGIKQKFKGMRQTLINEQKQRQDATEQGMAIARQKHAQDCLACEYSFAETKLKLQQTVDRLNANKVNKRLFELNWKFSKKEREGEKFRDLRFSVFLKQALGSR